MSEVYNSNSALDSDHIQNKSFPKAFRKKGIPNDEILLERYSCALQRDILLLQGFLYVSENYFCYYSNVVGFIHQVVIPLSKVKSITKKNAALVVPNAIQIDTKTGESYFMLSFINRDSVYAQLIEIWEDYKKNHRASLLIRKHMNDNEVHQKRSDAKLSKTSDVSKSNNDLDEKKNNNKKGNARFPDDINDDDDKAPTVTKYRRANSTPNFSPISNPKTSLSRTNTINMRDKKNNPYKKHLSHHSSNPKTHTKKDNYSEYDYMDDEKVQNDIIFPKYIPKIKTMKEYKFLKITLLLTCLTVGFVIIMSIVLRQRINKITTEVKNIQNDPFFSTNALDFSTFLSKKGNEDMKTIAKNKKALEKIKELSQKTGLSIPQLLNVDWNEYELVN